ncbi:fused response regulator/phosphatase [Pseudomaricurvus alkylphenolicus]|nr:fused response regulator/phosphatase [Pseudomaricurvus alkylphenolicus]
MSQQAKPLKILIADDTETDRRILEAIVRREGHEVISVCDGQEAVTAYEREQPDIVLLDALMPRLDGFGAARQIKELAGEELVPIIFLTSLSDTESLVRCLEAGGDDFLSKPYNRVILQAKIKAFNRMREMHQEVQIQRDQIASHNDHLMQEQTVAKQVFDNIAHTGCLDASNVKYLLSPLAVFNGDVIVAAIRPSGSMMVLLGDFTGHGLPAAIGAMPLASSFYGMVQKGFSMVDILREVNQKLKQILPIGVFCCASIVDMNFSKGKIRIWNGGLPDCYLHRSGTGEVEPIRSTHLPLGVLDDSSFKDDCLHFEMEVGDRLYMWSDGIIETRNPKGEMYGEERLQQVFAGNKVPGQVFDDIVNSVHEFAGGERDDDLSLIELTMAEPGQIDGGPRDYSPQRHSGMMEWSMDLELQPSTFRLFDPLPLLLNILVEVPGLRTHSGSLYTILAELYSNALEHGVLGLSSELKHTPEGFAEYYQQRQQRLDTLEEGTVAFSMDHRVLGDGGELILKVTDSGTGFDHQNNIDNPHKRVGYSGRGIPLIRTLCHSLRYIGTGNQVEVVFRWDGDD